MTSITPVSLFLQGSKETLHRFPNANCQHKMITTLALVAIGALVVLTLIAYKAYNNLKKEISILKSPRNNHELNNVPSNQNALVEKKPELGLSNIVDEQKLIEINELLKHVIEDQVKLEKKCSEIIKNNNYKFKLAFTSIDYITQFVNVLMEPHKNSTENDTSEYEYVEVVENNDPNQSYLIPYSPIKNNKAQSQSQVYLEPIHPVNETTKMNNSFNTVLNNSDSNSIRKNESLTSINLNLTRVVKALNTSYGELKNNILTLVNDESPINDSFTNLN